MGNANESEGYRFKVVLVRFGGGSISSKTLNLYP